MAGLSCRVLGVVVNDMCGSTRRRWPGWPTAPPTLLTERGLAGVPPFTEDDFDLRRDWLGATYGDPTPASVAEVARAARAGLALEPVYTGKALAAIRDLGHRPRRAGAVAQHPRPALTWHASRNARRGVAGISRLPVMPETKQYAELEASIDVAAPPAAVWAMVTDIERMASWSPQVVRTSVKGGGVQQGTRFSNLNRQGLIFWPTKGKVVRFEPHRDFAFRIAENRTIWSFELEPLPGGATRVTQRRELPDGISNFSLGLTKIVLGGVDKFTDRLRDGMRLTLERIKAEAES